MTVSAAVLTGQCGESYGLSPHSLQQRRVLIKCQVTIKALNSACTADPLERVCRVNTGVTDGRFGVSFSLCFAVMSVGVGWILC